MTVVRDVILRDGGTLRLRSPGPEDLEAIEAFFNSLSKESRYLRFHGLASSGAVARSYAEADGDARVALIAQHGDDGRIVAVAEYARLREPGVAEVAFAVADDHQGRGTGTRLLEQLADLAAERGLVRFHADVLPDNRAMLGVFQGAGFEVRREGARGEVSLRLELGPTERLAERISARHHQATVASLGPMISPASVAVIGASADPGSVGGGIFTNLVEGGFAGTATPVNRSGDAVAGVPAVCSLADLTEAPDLAVIAVPAAEVLEVAREAGRAGVRALSVVASGFADVGGEGERREAELLAVVREYGMRLLGPNSLGLLNTADSVRLDATLGRREVAPGGVALSSQSGALGLALLGNAGARALGVAAFVSLGNRADVSTNDLLELWEDDDRIDVITLYVESFGNPARFSEIAGRVSRRKPVLVVKGNRPRPVPPWSEAAEGGGSHTAASLRGEAVVEALFRQAGVLRVGDAEELFDAAELLGGQPLPAGRSVGVLTNSGGLGTLAADACGTRGLLLARRGGDPKETHAQAEPGAGPTANPVEMVIDATPGDYARGVTTLLDDETVDAVLVLYTDLGRGDPDGVLAAVDAAARGAEKPVVASVLDARGGLAAREGVTGRPGRVPNLRFVEACAGALARAADRDDWLSRPLGRRPELATPGSEDARRLLPDETGWLALAPTEELLAAFGIPVARARRCGAPDVAVAAATEEEGPVVLKADFSAPGYAADVDGVLLGLEGEEAIRAGWEELRRRVSAAGLPWAGAQVQPFVGSGADVLVGAVRDPDLGPVVGLGLGGRQAGLASDVTFRLRPVTDVDADDLLAGAAGVATLLDGFRGGPALDRDALRELVLRFGALLDALPELVEADLNPIRVMPEGCAVLDARLRIERRAATDRLKTW